MYVCTYIDVYLCIFILYMYEYPSTYGLTKESELDLTLCTFWMGPHELQTTTRINTHSSSRQEETGSPKNHVVTRTSQVIQKIRLSH